MKVLLLSILLIIFLYLNFFKKQENFTSDEILLPSNELDGDLNCEIDLEIIDKMNKMRVYIKDNNNPVPDIYKNLPSSYKNKKTYIQILYETYVDDFLDKYIVERFDAHKFIDITYKYPSYEKYSDKYPLDKVTFAYEKIFNDLLDPNIKFLYNEKDSIKKSYFDFTMANLTDNSINNLSLKIQSSNLSKFQNLYNTDIKFYISSILSQLNIIRTDSCKKNDENPFTFSFKKLDEENVNQIFELFDNILENELLTIQSF